MGIATPVGLTPLGRQLGPFWERERVAADPRPRPTGCGRRGARAAPVSPRDLSGRQAHRSEEHTSELQSRFGISYAVFCLKKKKYEFLSSVYLWDVRCTPFILTTFAS